MGSALEPILKPRRSSGALELACIRRVGRKHMASVDEVRLVFENPDFYLKRSRYNIRIRMETINDFTQGHDYKRVLDIGCGDGSLSAPLLRAHNRLTLLDVSSAMLLKACDQIPRELIRHVEFVN